MAKNVQMTIKMEPELHDQFMLAAEAIHTPAEQVIRQLMRKFITFHEIPSATTVIAMQSADKNEGVRFESAEALFKDLGI